jgi:hypothetical protein
MSQNGLVITASKNTGGKKDATGAFIPGAKKLCAFKGWDPEKIARIDNTLPFHQRGAALCQAIEARAREIDMVAVFCHGWSTGIQLGIRSPLGWKTEADEAVWHRFCAALAAAAYDIAIGLYACSTGDGPDGEETPDAPGAGDDSFGDLLRDELCCLGATSCRVVSHTTAGHAYHNPDVVLFDGNGMPYGARGGLVLVAPDDRPRRNAFRRLLRQDAYDSKTPGWGTAWRLMGATPRALALSIQDEVDRATRR